MPTATGRDRSIVIEYDGQSCFYMPTRTEAFNAFNASSVVLSRFPIYVIGSGVKENLARPLCNGEVANVSMESVLNILTVLNKT